MWGSTPPVVVWQSPGGTLKLFGREAWPPAASTELYGRRHRWVLLLLSAWRRWKASGVRDCVDCSNCSKFICEVPTEIFLFWGAQEVMVIGTWVAQGKKSNHGPPRNNIQFFLFEGSSPPPRLPVFLMQILGQFFSFGRRRRCRRNFPLHKVVGVAEGGGSTAPTRPSQTAPPNRLRTMRLKFGTPPAAPQFSELESNRSSPRALLHFFRPQTFSQTAGHPIIAPSPIGHRPGPSVALPGQANVWWLGRHFSRCLAPSAPNR